MDFIAALFGSFLALFGIGAQQAPPVVVPNEPVAVEEQMTDDLPEVAINPSVTEIPEEPASNETETIADEMSGAVAPTTAAPVVATLPPNVQTVLVAGGCFWCVEADMEKTKGVISAVSGYAGGSSENPTYKNYGSGGHREVVLVTYDANQVSYEDILIVTMKTTDPTDDDGTFGDRGDKYSAAFYYETPAQKQIIDALIADVNANGPYDALLAIDVEPRATFWPAEEYHQDYYKGPLTQVKYNLYRTASGRTAFIEKYWGVNDHSPELSWRDETVSTNNKQYMWNAYVKPSKDVLKTQLSDIAFKVTQEDGTERAGTSPLDKIYEPGIYVDILSGEPLYSSKDKFDSGTGWPSFVKPITPEALTLHEDRKLFSVLTETRSAVGDNHLGHVFDDGPSELGGKRYCMNGAALRFVPKTEMEAAGYADFLQYVE
jgi:peptide methionine sulfoxide reductase msrA/msrB